MKMKKTHSWQKHCGKNLGLAHHLASKFGTTDPLLYTMGDYISDVGGVEECWGGGGKSKFIPARFVCHY